MAAAEAEVTLICMDNSLRVFSHDRLYHGQIAAIRFYCETIFKCNLENTVGLFSMARKRFGPLLTPTRDLKKILSSVQDVRYDGEVEFSLAASEACSILSSSPPNMKKRLLMFVGGPINLQPGESMPYVKELKDMGVALDVVNFFFFDIDPSYAGYTILYGIYRYARKELDALVTAVNDNDNSHIEDVEDESSVIEILSKSILKKSLRYLEKKDAADEEYVEASGAQFVEPELERFHNRKIKSAADDAYLQAPGIEYLSNKNPRHPRKKNQKKRKGKVNV